MAKSFPVNQKRFDPYKSFKFRLKWNGHYVCGAGKLTGLKRSAEAVEHREGGDASIAHKSPDRTRYEPITLERGVTQDMAFHDWAATFRNAASVTGSEASQCDFRKEICVELYDEAGQIEKMYDLHGCWVSEYQAMPDLDANGHAMIIELMKIEHEGFGRDTGVTESTSSS